MPMSSADAPSADKPEPKAKPAPAKSGLDEAIASSDPLVQKLLWDRGHHSSGELTNFASLNGDPGNDARVAAIDAELRKLGFDI